MRKITYAIGVVVRVHVQTMGESQIFAILVRTY